MILRGSYKVAAFVAAVEARITGERPAGRVPAAPTDDPLYFGAGYWRGAIEYDATGPIGLRLINPDRTREEIAAVERGIAILLHCEYQRD